MFATDGLDHFVKRLKKTRPVSLRERWGTARYLSGTTKDGQEVPGRDRIPDVVLRKRPSCRADCACSLSHAAARQRYISGDYDVVRFHVIHDPIVGRVEFILYHFERNTLLVGDPHPGVGDQGHAEPMAVCHAVQFLFDGAGIGVDQDV
jgi:hypothetical protein